MATVTASMLETVSGIFIDLLDPRPGDININDIAWALSRQSRYAGHTVYPLPYTVAQHTVAVSRYVQQALTPGTSLHQVFAEYLSSQKLMNLPDPAAFLANIPDAHISGYAFHGLMHDFAEAYMVDLPNPVKRLPGVYEAYKAHELRFDAVIFERFGLFYSAKTHPVEWDFGKTVVGWADMCALVIEAYNLMPSRGLNWNLPLSLPEPVLIELRRSCWPVSSEQAHYELLDRFGELYTY